MILRPLPDPVKSHLARIPEDGIDIFLLNGGSLRGVIVNGTRLVHQARSNHGLSPLETTILGKALLSGALHSASLKGKDRVSMKIHCDGPAGGLSIETNVLGEIRGYIQNHIERQHIQEVPAGGGAAPGASYRAALEKISDSLIGSGSLTVTRFPEGSREPSTSSVAFPASTIDAIFESFYLQSDQVPSRIWTSFAWDNTLFLQGAAAMLLQTMPDSAHHSREDFLPVVQHLESLNLPVLLAQSIAEGKPGSQLVHEIFAEFDEELVGSKGIEFYCSCSKERFASFISGLPAADKAEIRQNGPFPLETSCHYCGTSYQFSQEELNAI